MKYTLLGGSGLRVSTVCLGTMTFGEEWGWGAGKDEARKIFDIFAEASGMFVDTANRYTNGSRARPLWGSLSPQIGSGLSSRPSTGCHE